MGGVGVVREVDFARGAARHTRRRRWIVPLALAVVIVAGVVARIDTTGGRLVAADGFAAGLERQSVGEQFNEAVMLTAKSAPSVVLDHVSTVHPESVDVRYSIAYTTNGTDGIGSWIGSTAPYDPVPVEGAHVGVGSPGLAWLIVSVVPKRVGNWRVSKLSISYHSWIRHRRHTAPTGFRLDGRVS